MATSRWASAKTKGKNCECIITAKQLPFLAVRGVPRVFAVKCPVYQCTLMIRFSLRSNLDVSGIVVFQKFYCKDATDRKEIRFANLKIRHHGIFEKPTLLILNIQLFGEKIFFS
jgi:hypothetical protein